MGKSKKLLYFLVIISAVALVLGFTGWALRRGKLHREEVAYRKSNHDMAEWNAAQIGISSQEMMDVMASNNMILRSGQISDTNLDQIISVIERRFAKDKSGDALVRFGSNFSETTMFPASQKKKIGAICIKIAKEGTDPSDRKHALIVIKLARIVAVRNDLIPITQDKDPVIAKEAEKAIQRLDIIKERGLERKAIPGL